MKAPFGIILFICMLFLFPCGAEIIVHPVAPIENPFIPTLNGSPGIFVKLRMENGKELLFLIDTGRPNTSIDKSLEPLLGKRLGRSLFFDPLIDGITRADVYQAPKLYLGHTLLLTNPKIYAHDFQHYIPGLMGILGMDCLRHYCVQFDFAHDKMRFLDPDHLDPGGLGARFPLKILFGLLITRADCFGAGKVYFCPDTGLLGADAVIKPSLFHRKLMQQKPFWTSHTLASPGCYTEMAGLTNGVFAGHVYTHLTVAEWWPWPHGDLLGFPFLSRHLVTFDFPKRVMFLKPQTSAPLVPDRFPVMEAIDYMTSLAKKNRIPGLSTNDSAGGAGPAWPEPTNHFPIALTFDLTKNPTPHWVDVTSRIKLLLANGARVILADDALAGCNPARANPKQLRINFSVGKLRRTVQAIEGQSITIPADAEIIRARYGFLQGTQTDPSDLNSHIDASQYHYTVVQKSPDGPWQLQKAWRTDKNGRVIEQYKVVDEVTRL